MRSKSCGYVERWPGQPDASVCVCVEVKPRRRRVDCESFEGKKLEPPGDD